MKFHGYITKAVSATRVLTTKWSVVDELVDSIVIHHKRGGNGKRGESYFLAKQQPAYTPKILSQVYGLHIRKPSGVHIKLGGFYLCLHLGRGGEDLPHKKISLQSQTTHLIHL